MTKNNFIYCTSSLLKRRISKVYVRKDGTPFVYTYDSEQIELSQLDRDFMSLPKFCEANLAHYSNHQNSDGWLYKLRKREKAKRRSGI